MIHCRVQALLETNLGVDPETVDGQPISQPISHSISQSISQPISARVPSWRLQSPDLPRHLVLLIILRRIPRAVRLVRCICLIFDLRR